MIGKLFPAWATTFKASARGKAPQPKIIHPRITTGGIQPTPARLAQPMLGCAAATPVMAAFILHGAHPQTTAFAPATRMAYAPRTLRATRQQFVAMPCPPQEVRVILSNGDVAYRFHGIPDGSGATCNFYRARDVEGNLVGVLEYRIGSLVIGTGPNARARVNVESIQRQVRVTRRACPLIEVAPPVVVDDVVYVGVRLMDASLRELVGFLQSEEVTLAEQQAFVRHCMRQILRGLAYADEKGVRHRDVKPDNILVNNEALCLLSDWGQASCEGETNTRLGRGTPRYAAPENALDEVADVRADMFSVGVTIAELLGADIHGLPGFESDARQSDMSPNSLLEQWFASRTDGHGRVAWDIIEARAEDRREEYLLRTIDVFALEARAGDHVLTDYLFKHLLRFDKQARHMPADALGWMASNLPAEKADVAIARRVMRLRSDT